MDAEDAEAGEQADQILPGDRIAAEDLVGAGLPVGTGAGQQILDRELGAVGQFGEREAELLEQGDARVVGVVVAPLAAAEATQQRDPLSPQARVIQGRMGVGIQRDRGGGRGHGWAEDGERGNEASAGAGQDRLEIKELGLLRIDLGLLLLDRLGQKGD
jgi:hypothetical protein